MLKLSVVFSSYNMYPETRYICKYCKRCITFYSTSPTTCYNCNSKFPDFNGLKFDPNIRIQWHSQEE